MMQQISELTRALRSLERQVASLTQLQLAAASLSPAAAADAPAAASTSVSAAAVQTEVATAAASAAADAPDDPERRRRLRSKSPSVELSARQRRVRSRALEQAPMLVEELSLSNNVQSRAPELVRLILWSLGRYFSVVGCYFSAQTRVRYFSGR